MSSSGITFSGLASGLDTQAIIEALLAVEQRPINALETRKRTLKNQLSLFGDLESKIEALRDAADAVRKSSSFLVYKADLDDETYLGASAGSTATAGTYQINVGSLAAAQSVRSGSYETGTDPEIGGSNSSKLTFDIDDGTSFDVDLQNSTYTLEEVASAINAEGQSITAQVVQVGFEDFRLVLTGDVGAEQAFSVTGKGTGSVKDLGKDLDKGSNRLTEASDAVITVNNLTVTRDSNTISDVISGVTLDLKAAHASGSEFTTLTVGADASATAAKVKTLVDSYNGIVDFMEAQSVIDEEGDPSSPLFGDSTLRSVRSTLRSILGQQATTSNQAYSLLSQVGVEADRDGRLTFTQSEFEEAVGTDETAVIEMFSNATNGFAVQLFAQSENYLDTVDGLLVARKNGFNDRIKSTDDQIARAEDRLVRFEAQLRERFANLEVLLTRLQGQGSALNALPSPVTSPR